MQEVYATYLNISVRNLILVTQLKGDACYC